MDADGPDYPTHLECDAVVADGGVVHVRPLRPDDRERLRALIAGVSDQSAYFRYFSRRRPLRDEELDRFVQLDYRTRLALGVEVDDQLVATGQYDTDPSEGRVEVAFLVHDDHQGRGIGTLLLDHLAAEARRQGIRSFHAETLGQNRQMLRVFAHAGLPIGRELDHGVWEIEMRLDAGPNPVEEQHEHRADVASIHPFLAPRGIAVVTGPGWEDEAAAVVDRLRAGGFTGRVAVCHPSATRVGDHPVVARAAAADGADLAVVLVAPDELAGALDGCGTAGLQAALVLSPGPDAGAGDIRDRARAHGLRLLGPGSVGVLSGPPEGRLVLGTGVADVPAGSVAVLSQSGNLGTAILRAASVAGVGISTFVSFGEKLDVSSNDVLQFLEDDEATAVVCLYLHSFGNPRKFARIARRLAGRRPVVVVRSGRHRTVPVRDAAGVEDAVVDALFQQAGLVRVDSIEAMLEVARVLADQPLPPGPRVAVVGNGQGLVAMTTDACVGAGLRLPVVLGAAGLGHDDDGGGRSNPLDLGEAARPAALTPLVTELLQGDAVDAVLVTWAPADEAESDAVVAALGAVDAAGDRPLLLALLGSFSTSVPGPGGRRIPVFPFPEAPAAALGHGVRLTAWRRAAEEPAPPAPDVDRIRAASVVGAVRSGGKDRWLEPGEVAELLVAYGVPAEVGVPAPGAGLADVSVRSVPGWGQVLAVGLAGELADLAAPACQLVPVTRRDAHRLLGSGPLHAVLARRPTDVRDDLVDVLVRLGRLADDIPELLRLSGTLAAGGHGVALHEGRARLAPHAPPSVSIRRLR